MWGNGTCRRLGAQRASCTWGALVLLLQSASCVVSAASAIGTDTQSDTSTFRSDVTVTASQGGRRPCYLTTCSGVASYQGCFR
jgi:hypothetical protein